MIRKVLLLVFTISALFVNAQDAIKWMTFEQAVAKAEKTPKKIFIDVYTDWCGWCKKMDQTTFSNPVIAAYMNKNFYAVKLDAERQDTVVFQGHTFINSNPGKSRSSHQLAQALLQGKMSYPSYVFMDEDTKVISVVPGYYEANAFEPVMNYFGSNAFLNTEWPAYNESFKGSVK
ncbi:MAG: DUF255 domain-containing protein [Ignavibacteria bacterium]|nr:DUF255 domain-containing protein [Ignavibacteria bacterium]